MKKIMFNERFGLQQATLDGSKTMTRRMVPDVILNYVPIYQQQYYEQTLSTISVEDAIINMVGPEKMFQQYVYQVGEVVAIAQRYSQLEKDIERLGLPLNLKEEIRKHKGYNNKMFVRAEDMPTHIKIIKRRLEHLQDISDEDCLREGIYEHLIGVQYGFRSFIGYCGQYPFATPRAAFAALIDKTSRKGTWDRNPFVFVYEYERID